MSFLLSPCPDVGFHRVSTSILETDFEILRAKCSDVAHSLLELKRLRGITWP